MEEQPKTESSNIHRGKGVGGTDPPTSPPFPGNPSNPQVEEQQKNRE
jgi:hypothetical protein